MSDGSREAPDGTLAELARRLSEAGARLASFGPSEVIGVGAPHGAAFREEVVGALEICARAFFLKSLHGEETPVSLCEGFSFHGPGFHIGQSPMGVFERSRGP